MDYKIFTKQFHKNFFQKLVTIWKVFANKLVSVLLNVPLHPDKILQFINLKSVKFLQSGSYKFGTTSVWPTKSSLRPKKFLYYITCLYTQLKTKSHDEMIFTKLSLLSGRAFIHLIDQSVHAWKDNIKQVFYKNLLKKELI